MKDEEIVRMLRTARKGRTAVELATLLGEMTDGALSQGTLITYFKRAYPEIPLRVLIDSGAWTRVSDGGLSDKEFNEMLGTWLQGRT